MSRPGIAPCASERSGPQYTGGMTRTNPTPPARRRHPAIVTVDVLLSIVLLAFSGVVAFVVVVSAFSYSGIHAICTPADATGIVCNSVVLGIIVYGLMTVAIIAAFLGFGMVIVSLIRRRWAFVWPLGAILLTIGLFYLASWVAGLTVPA